MTMITKTAETLQDGITNMMAAAKEDYFQWTSAGYNAPALNQPRGNVLSGNFPIRWTGPLYLK